MRRRVFRFVLVISALWLGQIAAAEARFLQTDPVGYKDDLNLYQYAFNDPLRGHDPSGREVRIFGDDNYREQVNNMLDTISEVPATENAPSGEAVVNELRTSPQHVDFLQPGYIPEADAALTGQDVEPNVTVGQNGGTGGVPGRAVVWFDTAITEGGVDDTGSKERPPVVGLGHELPHARDIIRGTAPPGGEPTGSGSPGTTPEREVGAINFENAVRAHLGLPPRSTYYPSGN